MKRAPRRNSLLIVLVLLCLALPAAAENMDLVVMVDTSESMFPYFDDLMNSLIQDLLTAKLHRGDSFHLLSFSSTPEVEIALEVNTPEAAERAFGRILLLHPLGRYTDLIGALRFLHTYVQELPDTNPKRILLLTDGVHDPPPGTAGSGSPDAVKKGIEEAVAAIRAAGWTVSIMKVPPEPPKGEAGLKSYLDDIAQGLGVPVSAYRSGSGTALTGMALGFPSLTFPAHLGKVGNRFAVPFRVRNNDRQNPILVGLVSIQSEGSELLEKKVQLAVPPDSEATLEATVRLPITFPRGEHAQNDPARVPGRRAHLPDHRHALLHVHGQGRASHPPPHVPVHPVHHPRRGRDLPARAPVPLHEGEAARGSPERLRGQRRSKAAGARSGERSRWLQAPHPPRQLPPRRRQPRTRAAASSCP